VNVPARAGTSTVRVAVAALVAALAAVLAARGPATIERSVVQWALPATPDAPTADPVFRPVLLAVHVPERLAVVVPCGPGTVPGPLFASTALPGVAGRLQVDVLGDAVLFRRDAVVLASVPLAGPGCSAAFEVRVAPSGAAMWSLARNGLAVAGGETDPPVVSGLLGVARATGEVRATLVARPSTTHPSAVQWVFLVLALGGVIVALRGSAGPQARSAGGVTRRVAAGALRPWRRRRHLVDAAVTGGLTGWALFGPWFFDDGWLMATVRAREGSGSFSNYFDTLATQMPLGFAHHVLLWPFAVLDAPFLVWRLVPLVACVLTWFLARRLLDRFCGPEGPRPATVVTLAVVHGVAAAGFLLTLRPEPVVAMLTVAALDRVLVHTATGAPRPLGVAFVLVAVACTLHPSGFVAVVALVPAASFLLRPAFRDRSVVVETMAMALCGFSAGVVLLFADTDLTRWRAARAAFAADGFHDNGPLDELVRYRDLLGNATVLQLAAVLAGGLALVAWTVAAVHALVARRRGAPGAAAGAALVPGLLLVLAVGLLALTPSKWIYHFGSVAAIAALAVAVEVERIARRPAARARLVAPAVVVAVALLGARVFTNPKDPQYFLAIGRPAVGVLARPLTWVVVAVVGLALQALPRARVAVASWGLASVLTVVLGAAGLTSVVRPALDGPAWSTPHALLDDLLGGGCPITDAVDVGDPRRAVPLSPAAGGGASAPAPRAPLSPPPPEGFAAAVATTGPASGPTGSDGSQVAASAWLGLPASPGYDLVVAVRGDAAAGVRVEWAGADGRTVAVRSVAVAPPTPSPYGPAPEWQLVRVQRARSAPPSGAVAVRAAIVRGDATVLGPVAMPSRSLRSVLQGARVLVSPPELPLLRCTRPARIVRGVAEVPDVVVGFEVRERVVEIPELQSESSPWYLATDVQPMRSLVGWFTDDRAVAVQVRDTTVTRPRTGPR
jgi:arabinosyltransferase B/arabinosyltransferase C